MMKILLSFLLILLSFSSQAEQSKTFGDLEVHYSTLPTTFLAPAIAKQYKIQRSRYSALINIAILNKAQSEKPAVNAQLSGIARNTLGQQKNLTFREIREGKAIYYLAEVSHSNEETLTFMIDIYRNGTKDQLVFKKTFFVDQ